MPGGTYFFTLVTEGRESFLCSDLARKLLRESIDACRTDRPFDADAFVLLPDHLHAIWTLPPGYADFSGRWAAIKARFTRGWIDAGCGEQPTSGSRLRHRHRGVWQRRFWEHWIRGNDDFAAHLDYVHFNPVKHGLVTCPHLWPYSTFPKWVQRGIYAPDWMCVCNGKTITPPTFDELSGMELE